MSEIKTLNVYKLNLYPEDPAGPFHCGRTKYSYSVKFNCDKKNCRIHLCIFHDIKNIGDFVVCQDKRVYNNMVVADPNKNITEVRTTQPDLLKNYLKRRYAKCMGESY